MKEEHGMTLIELLAVLALLSIIIALIGSAMVFGQKQYHSQKEIIDRQDEVRFIMSTLTKEIRSHQASDIKVQADNLIVGTDVYQLEGSKFLKNDTVLSQQIAVFEVKKNEQRIDISVTSLTDQNYEQKQLSTVLYLRE